MLKVFISSTGKDLAEYREAACRAVEGLDGFHADCMENWGARDTPADRFAEQRIAAADAMILIIGHCYGSSPPGQELSYTELEYEAAVRCQKPILCFVGQRLPLDPDWIEPDERRKRQVEFRNRVLNGPDKVIAHQFGPGPDKLYGDVIRALHHLEERPAAAEAQPPRPLLDAPRHPDLIGRSGAIEALPRLLQAERRTALVPALSGRGGTGKRRSHLLLAALAASAAALVAVSPVGRSLERDLGLPLLFQLRGPVDPPPGVVIVAQDVESSVVLGREERLYGFPRTRLAEVVKQVTAAGARALALDLKLDTAGDEVGNEKLAAALAANGKAVLFEESQDDDGRSTSRRPKPEFATAAAALAPFPLPDESLQLRVAADFWTFHGKPEGHPTLPAAALLVAALTDPAIRAAIIAAARAEGMPEVAGPLGAGASALPFDRRVEILRLALRGNAAAVRRLAARLMAPAPGTDPLSAGLAAAALRLLGGEDAYVLAPYGPAGRVPRVSYHRVLDGEREVLRELEGRIVFVGASEVENRARADDKFRTVLSGNIYHSGVEIAATACLNLLHGDAALTPAWPAMALFAGGMAAAVIAAFAVLPPLAALATLLLACAAATGIAYLALEMLRLVLPIASALVVSLPLGLLGGILLRYAALQRQLARIIGFP